MEVGDIMLTCQRRRHLSEWVAVFRKLDHRDRRGDACKQFGAILDIRIYEEECFVVRHELWPPLAGRNEKRKSLTVTICFLLLLKSNDDCMTINYKNHLLGRRCATRKVILCIRGVCGRR